MSFTDVIIYVKIIHCTKISKKNIKMFFLDTFRKILIGWQDYFIRVQLHRRVSHVTNNFFGFNRLFSQKLSALVYFRVVSYMRDFTFMLALPLNLKVGTKDHKTECELLIL